LAQYRAKMNTEAEAAFSRLAAPDSPYPEYRIEAAYWLAHILDRNDRKQQAITAFLNLAATAPESDLADDALLQAALLSKSAGERQAAVSLFNKLTAEYPASPHGGRARWEAGWSTYLSGAYQAAAELFQHLATDQSYRERALYWRGRALQASGAADAAAESFVALREEFPTGYYALTIEKETGMRGNRVPSLDKTALDDIQLPRGYERVKALLALGLREEAALELATCRQRDGGAFRNSIEHAGLYLALDNYRAAMGLLQRNQLSRNNPLAWAVLYPAGFHEIVARYSIASNVSESLTYALIKAESTFSPAVRSPVGAVGLMQLMPATARETAKNLGESLSVASLTTPEINVKLGTRHLKELLNRFDGNLINVIAAYNAGATPVNRWRKNFGQLRDDEFIENIPYPETREYVKKVLAGMEIYRRLYSLGDQPYPLAAPQEQQTSNKETERYAHHVPLDR
jgi:soluble lytic murein transglycosylase